MHIMKILSEVVLKRVVAFIVAFAFFLSSIPGYAISDIYNSSRSSCLAPTSRISAIIDIKKEGGRYVLTGGKSANETEEAFRERTRNFSLDMLFGRALKLGMAHNELVDLLVQNQSRLGTLLCVEIGSITMSDGSISCKLNRDGIVVRVRYFIPDGRALPANARQIELKDGGVFAVQLIEDQDDAVEADNPGTDVYSRVDFLIAQILSLTGKARQKRAEQLSAEIVSAPPDVLSAIFESHRADLSDRKSCLMSLLISISIIENSSLRESPQYAQLVNQCMSNISDIRDNGNLPDEIRARMKYYREAISQLPILFSYLELYGQFLSRSPPYNIEAMERAIYRVRLKYKGDKDRLSIINSGDFSSAWLAVAVSIYLKADGQWEAYRKERLKNALLEEVVKVAALFYKEELDKIVPDVVFRADAGMVFVYGGVPYVFLSNFSSAHVRGTRDGEIAYNRDWFIRNKYRTVLVPKEFPFEGSSEVRYVRGSGLTTIIMNYGFRTDRRAHDWIEERLRNIVPDFDKKANILHVRTVDETFTHLNTALKSIPVFVDDGVARETIMYYPAAFDIPSRRILKEKFPDAIIISESDAKNFAAESVVLGSAIVIDNRISEALERELKRRGFSIRKVDVSEFSRAGGGIESLTLNLNQDLLDIGIEHDNTIQVSESAQGSFDIQYVNNPWMSGGIGLVNKQRANKQHERLRSVLHTEGAALVPFGTETFARPYDLVTLHEAMRAFLNSDMVHDDLKDKIKELSSLLGGIIGMGEVVGKYISGTDDIRSLEEELDRRLGQDAIHKMGGKRFLHTLLKRFSAFYNERYAERPDYSLPALLGAVGLMQAMGQAGDKLQIGGRTLNNPEELWPYLAAAISIQEMLPVLFDDIPALDGMGMKEKPNGAPSEIADPNYSELIRRISKRQNGAGQAAAIKTFLGSERDPSKKGKYLEMLLAMGRAKDADLVEASAAILLCFERYECEPLYAAFREWADKTRKSPPYLFFIFYQVFGGMDKAVIRMIEDDLIEKVKGSLDTATEAHHRLIGVFAKVATRLKDKDYMETLVRVLDLARDLKEGSQLQLGEDLVQLNEALGFEMSLIGSDGRDFLKKVRTAKTYVEFKQVLKAHSREMTFRYLGIRRELFSVEETAFYDSIKDELDDVFSVLILNKNYRENPFLLLLVKLVYISLIKRDFNKIRYQKDYIPDYIDAFFNKEDAKKVRIFLNRQKRSNVYRAFFKLSRMNILKFWQDDVEFMRGAKPESPEDFTASLVQDCLGRSREFLSAKFAEEVDRLPPGREERGQRAKHLGSLGKQVDQVRKGAASLESLKVIDEELYGRIIAVADKERQQQMIKDAYDRVAREQKVLTVSNQINFFFDGTAGVSARLKEYLPGIVDIIKRLKKSDSAGKLDSHLIPDPADIRSIMAFDINKVRPYKALVDEDTVWKPLEELNAKVAALRLKLTEFSNKSQKLANDLFALGEQPAQYYYNTLCKRIQGINTVSADDVLVGDTSDPVRMMKALRGECYDYRDGLNSDVLVSMFFNPLVKVAYVRKATNKDYYIANQVFILSEVSENGVRTPVVTADYYYGEREYADVVLDMMMFYRCTPAGIEINMPVEDEEAGLASGDITDIQTTIFRDESWDVFLDITSRIPIARMTDFARKGKTVILPPFNAEESAEYAKNNPQSLDFYNRNIRPGHNFSETYLELLDRMVAIPSGTSNVPGVNRMADFMQNELKSRGFTVERISGEGKVGDHIVFTRTVDPKKPTVLLSGHMDTVVSPSTGEPCMSIEKTRITGPGVMDMKGGLAVMLAMLDKLQEEGLINEVNMVGVLNSEEETGSKVSRSLIEKVTRSNPVSMALVFEFNNAGEIIVARQGIGHFTNEIFDPSAADRLSKIVLNLSRLTREGPGDRVNVGIIKAIDPRLRPEHSDPLLRCKVVVKSDSGHAGRRAERGNLDCNYEVAQKMEFLEAAMAQYGGKVTVRHRLVGGGSERNKLSGTATWIFDMYADKDMDEKDREKAIADARRAVLAVYTPEVVTGSVDELPYSESPIWQDGSVAWGALDARVYIAGEYRFASKKREAPLKAFIGEFLGTKPMEPHRPVMDEHPIANNILRLVGYDGMGKFNSSAADSNFIASTPNSKGEAVLTFDGIGLTGDKAHSPGEFAEKDSMVERRDLAVNLMKQLLTLAATGEGVSLSSVKNVGMYGSEELATIKMTRDYAVRQKAKIFALQSSGFDVFEMSPDDIIADSWSAGRHGNGLPQSFPAKWEHSYAMVDSDGDIVAAIIAYESAGDAQSGTPDSVRIHYIMVDPKYQAEGFERELIFTLAKQLCQDSKYAVLSSQKLILTATPDSSGKSLFEGMGFLPINGANGIDSDGRATVYSVDADVVVEKEEARRASIKANADHRKDDAVMSKAAGISEPGTTNDAPGGLEERLWKAAVDQSPAAKDALSYLSGAANTEMPRPAIVLFSDNFLLDNAIPPYKTYERCRAGNVPLWIVVKDGTEAEKIRALGFNEGVRFEEVGDNDVAALAGPDKARFASSYNLACAEIISERLKEAGLAGPGKAAIITNPFSVPEGDEPHIKERFGRISARHGVAILIPQIADSPEAIVFADMLVGCALHTMNNRHGNGPLVLILPPIRNITQDIRALIEELNAKKSVVFAA